MHKGPARRENPAAPALFLRVALLRLRLAILVAGLSPVIPRTYGASQGSGDTRCDTRGAPHCGALYSVNSAPDFFHSAGPHVGSRGSPVDSFCWTYTSHRPLPAGPSCRRTIMRD